MKRIEKWYITNIRGKNDVKKWLSTFYSSDNKDLIILAGECSIKSMCRSNHVSYLWRFNYQETITTILNKINDTKLWVEPTGIPINSFEELYDYVYKTINTPKIKYIGQLVVYDICIRLVLFWGHLNLMPKEYVYIHALPKRAYYRLVKEGILKKIVFTQGRIKMTDFTLYFPNLRADEIEDLLCWIGKAIRILDKGSSKISIANILNEINKLYKA